MSLKNNLLENETVFYEFSPHWIVFLRPIVWLTLSLVILLFGPFYGWSRFQIVENISVYQCLASLAFILGFYSSVKIAIRFLSAYFILTNKRVIVLQGFFRQTISSIDLKKITLLEINQTLLGKILCYGDLTIGKGANKIVFSLLGYPQWVQELLQKQIEASLKSEMPSKKHRRNRKLNHTLLNATRKESSSVPVRGEENYAHE